MPLPLLFRHLVFSSSHRLLSSDPRMFVWHDRHTILMSIQPSHRQHCHHRSRSAFFSSSPVYFGTQYISRKPTRLIFLHAQVIRYLSFPPAPTIFINSDPKLEQWGFSQGEVPPPPFGCPPRGYLVAWPHRLCLRPRYHAASMRHEAARGLVPYTSSILFPRYSQASIPRRDSWLDLLSLFIQWTTSFSTVCHADFVATPFPGS